MKTVGKVVAVNGTLATVETVRLSACEGCHKKADGEGCSVCSLLGGEQKMQALAVNSCHAEVGDTVEMESDTNRLLRYAAILFLLPIFLCFAGFWLASLFFGDELRRAVGGILGFAAGMIAGVAVSKRKKGTADVTVTKVLMHGNTFF